MGLLTHTKTIKSLQIPCGGTTEIELNISAGQSLEDNPVDIMLLLDVSLSMNDVINGGPTTKLDALKVAANEFIDIINKATNGGTEKETLGGGTTIGIVSFSTDAAFVNPPGMTNNVDALKGAINGLGTILWTCHGCAFEVGIENLPPSNPDPTLAKPRIMVLFTDGQTTAPTEYSYEDQVAYATAQATAAKADGIVIYCIGLGNETEVNEANLDAWSTSGAAIMAPTAEDLIEAFETLAENITSPSATSIEIIDTVHDDFEIIGTPTVTFSGIKPPTPDPGYTVDIADDKKSIKWTITELGKTGIEFAKLIFTIKHKTDSGGGLKFVNDTISYKDDKTELTTELFTINNNNQIYVNCDEPCTENIKTECCIEPEDVHMGVCEDYKPVTLPLTGEPYDLLCNGRLLSLSVRLKGVCPGRKVAVGVIVYEVVNEVVAGVATTRLVPRGFKAVEVPVEGLLEGNSEGCICKFINIGPFDFILPEDTTLCTERDFKVKVIAHYSDSLSGYNITCPDEPDQDTTVEP